MEVKYTAEPGAVAPEYKSEGAAGADLCALLRDSVVLQPLERRLIPTGIRIEIPVGYEIQVRPRSGLALKHGVTVLNSPGTIDSDYRGEIGVLLVNLGNEAFTVENGDRVAQIVVSPVTRVDFTVIKSLSETERGEGGYGSTGRK